MDIVFLVLRLVLAGVFAVAAVAKLSDRTGSRQALLEFGVPDRFTGAGSVLLPAAELVIAAALLFAPLVGALAAIALLLVFVAAIANAMIHHRTPDCHCFGQLHSEPAGRDTLVRNAVLIVMALVVAVFGPGPSVQSWLGDRSTAELALLAVAVVAGASAAWLVARRANDGRRSSGTSARKSLDAPAGRPIGSSAPAFTVRDLDGNELTLAELCARGRPVVLVFVHPGCGPCQSLLPSLADWQVRLATRLTIVVISEGSAEDNRALREQYGIDELLLQTRDDVYRAYKFTHGTPAAVVVDPDQRIASIAVSGTTAVEELIRFTLQQPDVTAGSSAVP